MCSAGCFSASYLISTSLSIDCSGHGTYAEGDTLIASVAGVVERVNRLICVRPLKARYTGEIGDVVVGRITEVGQKRWKVDTKAKLESVLLLSSINLPGGVLVCVFQLQIPLQ